MCIVNLARIARRGLIIARVHYVTAVVYLVLQPWHELRVIESLCRIMSRVFLWSSHRCASTVFERSIQELNTVKSLHEPHCLAYFREDGSIRDDDDTDSVFEGKRGYILSQARGSEDYIVKELAYYISGSKGEFAQFKHTFLIRHPKAVAVSLHNVMKAHDQKVPFFTDTKELYNTYEAVKLTDANPIVISAEDLLSKPRWVKYECFEL